MDDTLQRLIVYGVLPKLKIEFEGGMETGVPLAGKDLFRTEKAKLNLTADSDFQCAEPILAILFAWLSCRICLVCSRRDGLPGNLPYYILWVFRVFSLPAQLFGSHIRILRAFWLQSSLPA